LGGLAEPIVDAYIDSFIREAWWHSGRFLFGLREQDGKLLDGRHGNITTVIAREKSLDSVSLVSKNFCAPSVPAHLALQVEEEDCRRHGVGKSSMENGED
jgi:hypothetical protein